MKVFIPHVGSRFRIKTPISVPLEWNDNNLVLLREMGVAGMIQVSRGKKVARDEDGNIMTDENGETIFTEQYFNKTVANPLYERSDSTWTPVIADFDESYVLKLVKCTPSIQGKIFGKFIFKIIEASDKEEIGCIFELPYDEFMGFDVEVIEDDL